MTQADHDVPRGDAASRIDTPAVCSRCGHVPGSRRIDWAFIGDEVRRGVFSMEHGLLRTLALLLFRPGRLLRDYLAGHRAGHVKPLWLLLTTAALVTLLNRYLPGIVEATGFGAWAQPVPVGDGDAAVFMHAYQRMAVWTSGHLALTTLLLVPLEAAALRLVFWRAKGLNYPEWLTLTAFLTAQSFLFWSMGIALRGVAPQAEGWAVLVGLVWFVVSLVLVFDDMPRWKSTLRSIVGLALYIGTAILLLRAFVVVMVRVTAAG